MPRRSPNALSMTGATGSHPLQEDPTRPNHNKNLKNVDKKIAFSPKVDIFLSNRLFCTSMPSGGSLRDPVPFLPRDVLSIVFLFVDVQDLLRLALVCKDWYRWVEMSWKNNSKWSNKVLLTFGLPLWNQLFCKTWFIHMLLNFKM